MKLVRLAVPLLLAVSALLAAAPAALAHTTLVSSDPADGATLDAPPHTITLRFAEAVTLPDSPITLTDPTGAAWTVGTATIAGATVQAPVEGSGPAGQYAVRFTVFADDGDVVRGLLHFTVASAGTAAAGSDTTGSDTAGSDTAGTVTATPEAPATAIGAPVTIVTAAPAPVTIVTAAPAPEGAATSSSSAWVWVAVAVVVVGVLAALGFVLRGRRSGDRL